MFFFLCLLILLNKTCFICWSLKNFRSSILSWSLFITWNKAYAQGIIQKFWSFLWAPVSTFLFICFSWIFFRIQFTLFSLGFTILMLFFVTAVILTMVFKTDVERLVSFFQITDNLVLLWTLLLVVMDLNWILSLLSSHAAHN